MITTGESETQHQPKFSATPVQNLKRLLAAIPDLEVVITSAWRLTAWKHLLLLWQQAGLPEQRLGGRTPHLGPDGGRGAEISQWLEKAQGHIRQYAVLDDMNFGLTPPIPADHVFICHPHDGLTEKMAQRLEAFLR